MKIQINNRSNFKKKKKEIKKKQKKIQIALSKKQ